MSCQGLVLQLASKRVIPCDNVLGRPAGPGVERSGGKFSQEPKKVSSSHGEWALAPLPSPSPLSLFVISERLD